MSLVLRIGVSLRICMVGSRWVLADCWVDCGWLWCYGAYISRLWVGDVGFLLKNCSKVWY